MATTRKYAHVRTRGLHWNPNDYIPTSLAAIHRQTPIFSSLIMDRWRRQAGRFANQPKSAITYPVANGINDPLTWAMLVDALLRLDPDTYINSAPLTAMLEPEYPQIIWDPVTVGRVLSELHLYASALQSMTHGRARLRREFRGYEEMPGEAAQRVIQETVQETQEASAH